MTKRSRADLAESLKSRMYDLLGWLRYEMKSYMAADQCRDCVKKACCCDVTDEEFWAVMSEMPRRVFPQAEKNPMISNWRMQGGLISGSGTVIGEHSVLDGSLSTATSPVKDPGRSSKGRNYRRNRIRITVPPP